MAIIHTESSRLISSKPEKIYAVLRDYQKAHPAILPPKYFKKLEVLEKGVGGGTVIEVQMKVMGLNRTFRLEVSEPEPGRVLVEEDKENHVITTFTLFPQGENTQVTISTDSQASPGLQGFFERLLNPLVLKKIFDEELLLLDNYLKNEASHSFS